MADIKPQFELFLSTVFASFAYRLNQRRIRQTLQPISVCSKATGRQRIGGVGKAEIKKRSIKSKDIWGRKKWLFPNAKWRSQIDSLALANKNKINLNEKVNDKSIKGLNLIYQGQDSFYWLFYPSDANVCSTKAMSWPILLLVLKT